jgi:hypothetical protein
VDQISAKLGDALLGRADLASQLGALGAECGDHMQFGQLERQGITRYVFQLNSVGQFDACFSVWAPTNEGD